MRAWYLVPVCLAAILFALWAWRGKANEAATDAEVAGAQFADRTDTAPAPPSGNGPIDAMAPAVALDSERIPIVGTEAEVAAIVEPPVATWTVSGRAIVMGVEAEPSAFRVSYGTGVDPRKSFGLVDVSESGEWGPVELKFESSVEYWFRLEGGGAVPNTRQITAEAPGQAVVLDLEARPGEEMWFEVYGDDGDQLSDALVEVRWNGDESSAVTWARPREDGYIWVRGCMPGTVNFEVSAPGYASMSVGPRFLPEADPGVIQIRLFRTGRIEGLCRLGDVPVTDFEVSYWPAGILDSKQTIAFTDRSDGTFELPDVRVGNTRLIAMSPSLAQGAPVEVPVLVGQTSEARLELSRPLRGAGRIVDRATGDPIPGAKIQLFSSCDGNVIQAWGDSVTSIADGSFELDGLSRETQYFTVRASGYGAIYWEAVGEPDGITEIGDVLLSRTQDLEIRLVDTPGVDFTKLTIDPGSGSTIERFSSDGIVRYQGFPATSRAFVIDCSDMTRATFSLELFSGEDWTFDIEPFGERTLVVELSMADGSELPWYLEASVKGVPLDPTKLKRRILVPDDGRVVFEHLPWDRCSLLIALDDQRTIYESVIVDFEGRTRVELRKELQTELLRLRVVDEGGRPVPSLGVIFYGPSSQVAPTGMTDADGLVKVGTLPDDVASAVLYHQSEGVAIGVPVDMSGGADEVIQLVYDATSRLEARLLDGDQPAPGIRARLGAQDYPGIIAHDKNSGANGLVEWGHLNHADFIVRTSHPDYWPTESLLPSGSTTPHDIQVRRLGGIDLRVTDEFGQAVAGASVAVQSSEFGESLGQWIETGRVPSIPGGLTTGASGGIQIVGVPHGEYAMTATSPDGHWEAVVQIDPGDPTPIAATIRE